MAREMRAAVFRGVGKPLAIAARDMPEAGPGELLLKVAYCGICGSDLHATDTESYGLALGATLGHEFSGEVVASGSADFRAGDRIAVNPIRACDDCASEGVCRDGLGALCPNSRFTGLFGPAPGGYAEYATVRAAQAIRLPDGVSLRDGALLEPLAVGAHAVAAAGPVEGSRVLVLGAGPIGVAVAIMARLDGAAHVAISEPAAGRRRRAAGAGVDPVLDPAAGDLARQFAAAAGRGPDVIFDCVGKSGLLQQCIELSGPRGRVVVVGVCMTEDRMIPRAALKKELAVRWVLAYTAEDFDRVVGHMRAGRIDGASLVSSVIGFADLPRVFEELRTPNDHLKVLIDPALPA
ncbi:(R,R)-butanediol dehydrogenase/meso-butanediol dehydrogenase/diacetyl reductase [Constrictibacter sp. MBR-5]|uniref:alcohol dehydrogenase catalytic domain-containing protein n=1 Tax=Constrictibacter sp. MBR-5 TaxID=3156467 RepID=UPI003397AB1C